MDHPNDHKQPRRQQTTPDKLTIDHPLQPDVKELILCTDTARYACDTFIFEPSPGEEALGFLFAAAETENREGVGQELINTVISAIQKEYYRDPNRRPGTSLEMALHQANLILYDASEHGVRNWMGYFHVSVGVLTAHDLHISVAGGGKVLLARKSHLTDISEGLSHYPITNPLQTFSQLASGEVTNRDTLFFATSQFDALFRPADVTRFTLDHSAATISSRLEQLYNDQNHDLPLSLITISLLPQYIVHPNKQSDLAAVSVPGKSSAPHTQTTRGTRGLSREHLMPRRPLVIHRSTIQSVLIFLAQAGRGLWHIVRSYVWPVLKHGSRHGGRALVQASRATSKHVYALAGRSRQSLQDATIPQHITRRLTPGSIQSLYIKPLRWVLLLPRNTKTWARSLPASSKVFGIIALILVVALGISITLLQRKRTADQEIQRASEILYEARTKKDAAQTALIYDNRDQARGLLEEAQLLADQLAQTGLYEEETTQLTSDITTQYDRLQRITRANATDVRIIGDVGVLISGSNPTTLFFIDDALYTVNPDNNAVVKLSLNGYTEVVQQTTQGIGFISYGVPHRSDKTITFSTQPAGIAIFDTKDSTLVRQDIVLPQEKSEIGDLDIFGNRLYVYDTVAKQIYAYNKTLRGYSSSSAWITDEEFPKDTIKSFAIDGNVFTLHTDGTIRRLFKGAPADFVQEKVDPSLATASRIKTSADMQYLYIIDPPQSRIVLYEKTGALVRQIYIETDYDMGDVAIDPDEKKLYVLDGTRVLEVSLEE